MASSNSPLPSPSNPPQHTFLDKKPPLLPRQSTSDVLSFTHIITNRLKPGQNVWDFFSPAPPPPPPLPPSIVDTPCVDAPLSPISPIMVHPTPTTNNNNNNTASSSSSVFLSPSASPVSPTFQFQNLFGSGSSSRRQSLVEATTANSSTTSTTTTSSSSSSSTTSTSTTDSTSGQGDYATPKLQKRRSFAQSLKHGMLSLTQLLSPTSSSAGSSRLSSPTGPPHYNILVLGSDSAPLASTLYKMSSLLPGATKISHYQEISGFFVAYFRANGSFSCSPKIKTPRHLLLEGGATVRQGGEEVKTRKGNTPSVRSVQTMSSSSSSCRASEETLQSLVVGEGRSYRRASTSTTNSLAEMEVMDSDYDDNDTSSEGCIVDGTRRRRSLAPSTRSCSSAESLLSSSSTAYHKDGSESITETIVGEDNTFFGNDSSVVSPGEQQQIQQQDQQPHSTREQGDIEQQQEQEESAQTPEDQQQPDAPEEALQHQEDEGPEQKVRPSANATLSVHAFSLDTTWPVPRILAQTFWFPFAHGIIYIVDATRKNDPRGIDHLLNARQFLASLVADPHFKRRDIPVVVFANKAGLNPETCYRVDEIAEILGCEEWDHQVVAGDGGAVVATRPWCVKSTRADGAGEGLRESVEWLKSRMGEVWKS
ncbi:hypothetical protein CPB97_000089 [Podila verticillata]|nr:hypothetical protein CPB97_000089 [Podila verticillata]